MSLKLRRKKGSTVPPLESGAYFAVCIGIVELGHQYSEKYKNSTEKVMLMFEIPSERVEVEGESKPRWISQEYTKSLNEKAKLTSILIAWRGRNFTEEELNEFDLTSMIGAPATLQIIQKENDHTGVISAKIAAVTGLPKGVPLPKPENDFMIFDIDEPDEAVFEKLPEWIQKKIKASDEYADSHVGEEILDIDTETGEVLTSSSGSGAVPF